MRNHSASPIQRLARTWLHRSLDRLTHGRLELVLPDGSRFVHGPPGSGAPATLVLSSWRFFARILFGGEFGFAESYMAGEWDCYELPRLFRLLIDEREALDTYSFPTAWPRLQMERVRHRLRANTLRGSRRNIRDHYDLGNDFFRSFLDDSMTYSCGMFEDPGDSLARAQERKLDRILAKAEIRPEHHVLDMGGGWGSFALHAARQVGCRVTSVTLSREQQRWCEMQARAEGLDDRVRVRLCDYRQIEGRFDRIVSIEMLEAIGEEHLDGYFVSCDRLLRPGGRMVLQVINLAEPVYESYRRSCDFIQRFIFPGCHIPSLERLQKAVDTSRLEIVDAEDIGLHYPPTLRAWRDRLQKSGADVERLGFGDQFVRRWLYYFSYCEAGFEAGTLHDHQLVLAAPA